MKEYHANKMATASKPTRRKVAFQDISMVSFWSMIVFLGVLTLGFAYEWKKGAMEWQ